MERRVPPEDQMHSREYFFLEVLDKANEVSHRFLTFQSSNRCYQMRSNPKKPPKNSPKRNEKNDAVEVEEIVNESRLFYEWEARKAVDDLMSFLANLSSESSSTICVTYFDEAHTLQQQFWVLLRLVGHQHLSTEMWYVFMGTKSSVSYFSPSPQDCESPIFALPCVLISHEE